MKTAHPGPHLAAAPDCATVPEDRIAEAARLLIAARGAPRPRLPDACRPCSMQEAEAVQRRVMAVSAAVVGGWKVGRTAGLLYAAPIDARAIWPADDVPRALAVPAAKIELELGIRFRMPLDTDAVGRLVLTDLPHVAELVPLFEVVSSRFAADAGASGFERIADCVSNLCVVTGPVRATWTLPELLEPEAALLENGVKVACHRGGHPSAPLSELLEVWQDRCLREGCGAARGELLTWGSLTGVHPIPLRDADYLGSAHGGMSICQSFRYAGA